VRERGREEENGRSNSSRRDRGRDTRARGDAMVDEGKERGVPTVSLTLYDGDFEAFVRALGEAYERFGFVILENHGIEQALIERAMERSRAFFARDEACKKKYTLAGLGGARGYTSFGVEQAKGANVPGT
jgi:isopenicillin N synthase-like dioxygenase